MESSQPSNAIEEENHESSISHVDHYKHTILTLPRNKGIGFRGKDLYQYQGFWYDEPFLQGTLSVQQQFKPRDCDVIVCSAPKSGTTWLKALTFAITTRTCLDDSKSPLFTKMPHTYAPHLELETVQRLTQTNRNSIFGTHIPFNSLPKSVMDSKCKIVYICRDPKDVFVSLSHFVVELPPMEEAFQMFCDGIVTFGPYWEHILGYLNASIEFPERVLFLKYEDVKKETVVHVKKLAEFMGYPFSKEEEEDGVIEKVVHICSFEVMSQLEVNKNGKYLVDTPLEIANNAFFRKAGIGDWKNHLTEEMAARLDFITKQKLSSSGLDFHG